MRAVTSLTLCAICLAGGSGRAGQVPNAASAPDVPISARDRVYAAEQFSNTVSVTSPAENRLLGVIRLGDPEPGSFSPLYKGQLLVHGLGYSPDARTLAVVSVGSNSVTFIDTATNAVRHTTYVGRSPHEAFFTPDGREVWVTIRGENYVSVLDAATYEEKARIPTPDGPGMQIFSPDGKYGYICSSFTPETIVVEVATRQVVGRVRQDSPFCPNIAASPDGRQVWFTLKDVGRTTVFDAQPPFGVIRTMDTGPITNHVNFARTPNGTLALVTVGGLNQVKVFRTDDFSLVKTIDVGKVPHGVWPAGDGTRVYVGLENGDALAVIDTSTLKVIGSVPVGQAPQAMVYVPNAVPQGDGLQGLVPLGLAGSSIQLSLRSIGRGAAGGGAPTSVTLFEQGLTQVLEAVATGLAPRSRYVLGLTRRANGTGPIEPLAEFTTNPAGAAVVNAIGPLKTRVANDGVAGARRYLVIAPGPADAPGRPVQVQDSRAVTRP